MFKGCVLSNIRKATRSDAKSVARIAEETFRETFGAANTLENLAAHCHSNYSEGIQADEIASPIMVTLVAEQLEELVGFAQLRWSKSPSFVRGTAPAEIQRLYVASNWHGKGIAQALMAACMDEMKTRGADVAWLGVWEHNLRAIAFYKRLRFTECGEHVFLLGNDPQRDIVMSRLV